MTVSGADAKPVLGYGTGGALGVAGIRRNYPPGHGSAIFLGFGFETINPRDKRILVMDRLLGAFTGPTGVVETREPLPSRVSLQQNYPNPFNPRTTFEFEIPAGGDAELLIMDLLGREVARLADGYMLPGVQRRTWDASDQASGLYIAILRTRASTFVRKVLLLR
jgi:hypothetical protein